VPVRDFDQPDSLRRAGSNQAPAVLDRDHVVVDAVYEQGRTAFREASLGVEPQSGLREEEAGSRPNVLMHERQQQRAPEARSNDDVGLKRCDRFLLLDQAAEPVAGVHRRGQGVEAGRQVARFVTLRVAQETVDEQDSHAPRVSKASLSCDASAFVGGVATMPSWHLAPPGLSAIYLRWEVFVTEERRTEVRIQSANLINYSALKTAESPDEKTVYEHLGLARTEDLSGRGCRLVSGSALPVGLELDLSLQLGDYVIKCKGQVVRSTEVKHEEVWEQGIVFVEVDELAQDGIRNYLSFKEGAEPV